MLLGCKKTNILKNRMEEKDLFVRLLWDYHHMHHPLRKVDCILVLGSHDIRVAEHASHLFLQGLSSQVIFSGGLGRLTDGIWNRPEADVFAERAIDMGVPSDQIWIENKSTNTGENLKFVQKLLDEKQADYDSMIVVQKPYMERRAYATFKKHFPYKNCLISSPPLSFEEYCVSDDPEISPERVIHLMVGDLQRIWVYADKGYQVHQSVPDDVLKAYKYLVDMGYTDHLVDE